MNKNLIKLILISFLFYYPLLAIAGSESKFKSVEAMIEEFSDYSVSNKTFKILKNEPLHIQLSPRVVKSDPSNVIELEVKRAVIYGVYRTFVHTNEGSITVTAIPREINFDNKKEKYLKEFKRTISITREKALELLKKNIKVKSFSQLVTEKKIGSLVFKDQWSKSFNRIYYNDQGSPGINLFFGELTK